MDRITKNAIPEALSKARLFTNNLRGNFLALLIGLIIMASSAYFLYGQYKALNGLYFLIDDTWIHLRFAQNLASGYGFSFNPGYPIAASTAPLWTILLSFSYKFTGSLIFSAYFWGIAFFIITCFLIYKLILLVSKNFFLATASTIVTALCPWLTWSALSGMEIPLSATLILASIYLHLKHQDCNDWRAYLGTVSAGFTTLTRPETYVLFLTMVIHKVILGLLSNRQRLRRTLLFWLPIATLSFTLVILPYGLFSLKTTGSIFPNTYTAKVGSLGLLGAIKENSLEAIQLALFTNPKLYLIDFTRALRQINPTLTFLLPLGVIGLLHKSFLILPLLLVLSPLIVGMIVPTDRISWPWNRHMLNLIPIFITTTLVGNYFILRRVFKKVKKWATPIQISLLSTLTVISGLFFVVEQAKVRKFFIDRGAAMKTEHITVANWINQNLPLEAIIAASDIGVIGFYTQHFIIDTEGLITPEILGQHRRNSPDKDQEIYQYLEKTKPDYLVKFSWVYPSFPTTEFLPIYKSGNLVVYQTPWTRF